MKISLVKIGVALAVLLSQGGFAEGYSDAVETVSLGSVKLYPNQMESVALDGWRNVQKLYINATGNYGDAMFEVIVNGDIKGTIHVPGRDPQYIVTVNEVASSIQLRHLSGSSVSIHNIRAVQSIRVFTSHHYPEWNHCQFPSQCVEWPASNVASGLARRAISLVDQLAGYADYQQYGYYLLPIKKAAARVYAASQARGPLSGKVRELLLALQAQIAFARPYLENTFERTYAFELAVELLSLEHKLSADLF